MKYNFITGEIQFLKSYIYKNYFLVKRLPILSNLAFLLIRKKMSTIDDIAKNYDKNLVLRDCQRQPFEHLQDKKGDLLFSLSVAFGQNSKIVT